MEQLRPLTVGDLFDETIKIYRRHFGQLIGLAAFMQVPTLLAFLLVGGTAAVAVLASGQDIDPSDTSFIVGILGAAAVAMLVAIVTAPVGLSAMLQAIAEARFGRRIGLGEAIRRGFRRYWGLLGLGLVYTIAVGLMWLTILGIPFGIYFSVAWGLCVAVYLVEGTGVFESLSRSRALVRGMWWRTLGIALLFTLFQSVIGWIISFPLGFIAGVVGALTPQSTGVQAGMAAVNMLGSLLGGILPLPVLYIGWMLYYFDLRVRKEGLDLQMRAGEIGQPAVEAGTVV
jgi:hypothetical protein